MPFSVVYGSTIYAILISIKFDAEIPSSKVIAEKEVAHYMDFSFG